jgi:hypothetical protein
LSVSFLGTAFLVAFTQDKQDLNSAAIKSIDFTELVLAEIKASTKSGSPFVFKTA